MRWACALGCSALVAIAVLPVKGAQAQPAPGPPMVIDGPSASIVGPVGLGLSIARDGSGAVVYLKQVAGVEHVFVSRLAGGVFQAPEQIDAMLAGASSQPVIAAGDGGLLLVAFINGGGLYVAGRPSTASGWSPPSSLFTGALNPSLQMTDFGKAYLAFTAADGSGYDVRSAYYNNGNWALEGPPLNMLTGDDAGTGSGRPQVAAAGDGVGIVVWGEGAHVFSRRVWGTAPSILSEQADGALPGCTELSADEPVVGSGGNSSFADVAFHERLSCGPQQQARVLIDRLRGSVYDGIIQADGLSTPASDGADQPRIAVGEYGRGWVTAARASSGDVYAMALGADGSRGAIAPVNALANSTAPYAVPAIAGLFSDLITWQHSPGGLGMPEIRLRYAPAGAGLGPEAVLSDPGQGPTDAASGLAAAGDVAGDAAVVWVQGTGSSAQIAGAQLYQPPGSFAAVLPFRYARLSQPTLAWAPAHQVWGPLRYTVSVDGVQIGQATGTSLLTPSPLRDGPHRWQVTAVNRAGLQSTAQSATVFVDTLAPTVSLKLSGARRARSVIHINVSYSDGPGAASSGISEVVVRWGDGTSAHVVRRTLHVYRRAGRYVLTVTVKDQAGNTTTLTRHLRIVPAKRAPHAPARKR